MYTIQMSEYKPLSNHQTGIKIKNLILKELDSSDKKIVLDFNDVEVCTDSFVQQLTMILSQEIGFELFRKRVKFINLNDFLKDLVRGKLLQASKHVA